MGSKRSHSSFIDRVDNYAKEDGIIRTLFVKAFNDLKLRYEEWRDVEVDKVQAAYFAAKRTRGGDVIFEDSKTGESEKDREAYNLIMRDKERLLSFDEPTCFIFSHSALREGWDSPNVFQICTLNQTASEMKKRQEIGRGVRLAVNQSGDRVRDERVNILTVVANESYDTYVSTLQSEIEQEFGKEGMPPRPADARKQKTVHLRKEYMLKNEFKELWERIKHRTRYAVKIDTDKLIGDVVSDLENAEIRSPRIVIGRAAVTVDTTKTAFTATAVGAGQTPYVASVSDVPNIVEIMANLMEHTTPPMRVTRSTLLEIFRRSSKKDLALQNPYEFAHVAVHYVKLRLADQLVDGIQYSKINEWYEMTQFELESVQWEEYLVPSQKADGSAGVSLYDHVFVESGPEREFVEGLERDDRVKMYFKLPAWFNVDTPIGPYNPDWAIVFEERDEFGKPKEVLYLVRETKDTTDLDKLRPDEKRKIMCGEKHFEGALGVNYKVVKDIGGLLP